MHGTLTGIDWENPHAYVRLDVKDADGKVESWSLEMITPLAMKRNGTSREDFLTNMGKPMAVRACPGKVWWHAVQRHGGIPQAIRRYFAHRWAEYGSSAARANSLLTSLSSSVVCAFGEPEKGRNRIMRDPSEMRE